MIMRTTTKAGKNHEVSRKVKERVETIETNNFSLKPLCMIHRAYSLSDWELSMLGQSDKISEGIKITKKNIQKLKKKDYKNPWDRSHKTNRRQNCFADSSWLK